jgi:dTDP-4-amino-4,6-dideoxygalactose transaminase
MINVTKTFLPLQSEYQAILKRAWDTGWITNRGVLVNELESKLKEYLSVSNVLTMTNGTLPLHIAIKALQLKGEIITTPFSYVATTSSIVWEGCIPVFVDIHPEYLTIDETKIEAAITSKTTGILVTHVFGNPCDVDAIRKIADKYQLKVVYDAAHCFGVKYKGESVFNYGDVSTCSFHATKLFHTGEGGALFCKPGFKEKMFHFHNFGHLNKESFATIGTNAKMSEPQAAMGLAILPYMETIFSSRKEIVKHYETALGDFPVKRLKIRPETQWNYSYYPVIFKDEVQLLRVKSALESEQIFTRRYFYPSLNKLPYVSSKPLPIAESISNSVLCLPLFVGLKKTDIDKIIKLIKINL